MIFETHSHLNDPSFNEDLEKVLLNAKENRVTSICVIGYDKESSLKAVEICKKYKNIGISLYPVCGLHPENVNEEEDKDLNWLIDLLKKEEILSIGEIGIDLHWDKTNLDKQIYFFEKQLRIAKEYDKPVIIHTRDSIQVTYDIVKKNEGVKGIFHCFSGSVEMAKLITALGYKLGIGGVLTFKNSHLPEVLEKMDIKNFVTETDCPYMAPSPNRGKRNEPAYLVYIVSKIASIKGEKEDIIEEILYNNAKEILRIK